MPSNLLKAVIQVVAPGAQQTFDNVANGTKKTQTALLNLNTGVSKLGNNLETLKGKLGARQSFLNVETDITKVAILNREIKELEAEISRIEKIGVSGGLDGIGGGATKAFSAVRQLAFILPGIGIAGIFNVAFEGIQKLFSGLSDLNGAFGDGELAAAKFSQELDNAKRSAEEFKDSLDFETAINKLKAELQFGQGFQADILGFKFTKEENDVLIKNASDRISEFVDRIGFLRNRAAFFLSKSGQDLINNFFPESGDVIPDNLIDKLSAADKKIFAEVKSAGEQIAQLGEQRNKAFKENKEIELKIQIAGNEEAKKIHDKNAKDYEKYLNDLKQIDDRILARATLFVAEFGERLVLPNLKDSFFKTRDQLVSEAKQLLSDIDAGNLKIKVSAIEIDRTVFDKEDTRSRIQKQIDEISKNINVTVPIKADLKPSQEIQNKFNNQFTDAAEKLKTLQGIGEQISDVFSSAFDGLFQSISKGTNAIEGFFKGLLNGIGQVIAKLIEAAAISAILSVLFPKLGSFKELFGKAIGFRAAGGPVSTGKPYVIGENGPELFVPNTGGRIEANGRFGGGFTTSPGSQRFVELRLAGNDLIAAIAVNQLRQGRLS